MHQSCPPHAQLGSIVSFLTQLVLRIMCASLSDGSRLDSSVPPFGFRKLSIGVLWTYLMGDHRPPICIERKYTQVNGFDV